jgi:putative tricarboxylic transport membrane protein
LLNAIFLAMIASALLLFIGGRFVTSQFAHILKLPYPLLGTFIVALALVGAYSLKNSYYDVFIMFIFSLVGYFFDKFNYSNAALILGLILGDLIENSLRRQIIVGEGSLMGFVTRPLALAIIIVAIIAFIWPAISKRLKKNKT